MMKKFQDEAVRSLLMKEVKSKRINKGINEHKYLFIGVSMADLPMIVYLKAYNKLKEFKNSNTIGLTVFCQNILVKKKVYNSKDSLDRRSSMNCIDDCVIENLDERSSDKN